MGPLSGDSMDKDVIDTLDEWTVDMEEHGDMVFVAHPPPCTPWLMIDDRSVNVKSKPKEKYPGQ
jgi:hypothetical protein